jgi:hypothetical protein
MGRKGGRDYLCVRWRFSRARSRRKRRAADWPTESGSVSDPFAALIQRPGVRLLRGVVASLLPGDAFVAINPPTLKPSCDLTGSQSTVFHHYGIIGTHEIGLSGLSSSTFIFIPGPQHTCSAYPHRLVCSAQPGPYASPHITLHTMGPLRCSTHGWSVWFGRGRSFRQSNIAASRRTNSRIEIQTELN